MENYKYYYKDDFFDKTYEINENIEILNISGKDVSEIVLPPNLINLQCFNNKIAKLDVSKCLKLEILDCSKNQLSKLDIINNKKLTNLNCNKNQLSKLDIGDNDNLIDLSCYDNIITKLDVTNCTKLETLDCSNNKLNELNVNEYLKYLECKKNKLLTIEIPNDCKVNSDSDVTFTYKKRNVPNFNQTEYQVSNLILKIKNPVLWSIADLLTRNIEVDNKEAKFNIKEIKKIATTTTLGQMLTKKEGSMLLKKHSNGFTILDIENLSFELENKESLLQNKNIEITHSTWNGTQRYFNDEVNYVFQVNLKPFKNKEILDSHPKKDILNYYITKGSIHPTSKITLTLAWVRYTFSKEQNAIILDEIQTDLTGDDYKLGDDLMDGWDEFSMKLFIQYVRKQYKVRKIYMPTYDTRTDLKYYPQKDKYTKLPPMHLYKELPNKFGFKKHSDLDGFMVLENNLFETFKDYLQNNK